jgi:hypothetical protein
MPSLPRVLVPLPLVPLALALFAWSAPLAWGQDSPPVRRVACGSYEIVPSGFRRANEPSRLSIQKGGRLLVSITDWRVVSVQCDDITADRIPELVVRTSTGGAHCCETLRVYALGETPRLLLVYEANNAAGVEVRDINGDGRRELILGDDSFAYFGDLCYACSPSNLPMVACYTGGRFDDCTKDFPDLLRERRDAYLAKIRPARDDTDAADVKGAALGVVAISELLGEEEQGMAAVRSAGAGDAVMAWLAKALPQVRDWAAARGKKLKAGKE